jgi:hypothetical protein
MNSECQLVLEIWELVRDHVAPARRLEIAAGLLRAVAEYGFEAKDLYDIIDEDSMLAKAFAETFDEEIDEEDEENFDE